MGGALRAFQRYSRSLFALAPCRELDHANRVGEQRGSEATRRREVHVIVASRFRPGGQIILAADKSSENAQRVVACAEAIGIQVVDQFQSLRAILVADPNAARDYYHLYQNGLFGHMTAKGNEHAAKLLADALSK